MPMSDSLSLMGAWTTGAWTTGVTSGGEPISVGHDRSDLDDEESVEVGTMEPVLDLE